MRTMRLSIAVLIILALLGFAFPIISHADTGSNQSQLISLLQQLVTILEAQLQQIILQMQAQTVQPATNPPQQSTSPQTTAATVTLAPAPTCTLTANPTSIIAGKSSTLTWTSSNATAASISPLGSTLLSSAQSVSPSYTTLYFGIFTGPGGRAVCSAIVGVTAAAAAQNPAAGTAGGTGTTGGSCVATWSGSPVANGQLIAMPGQQNQWNQVTAYVLCKNGQFYYNDGVTPYTYSGTSTTDGSCVGYGGKVYASGTMASDFCDTIQDPVSYQGCVVAGRAAPIPMLCSNGQWVSTTQTTGGSCTALGKTYSEGYAVAICNSCAVFGGSCSQMMCTVKGSVCHNNQWVSTEDIRDPLNNLTVLPPTTGSTNQNQTNPACTFANTPVGQWCGGLCHGQVGNGPYDSWGTTCVMAF